LDKGADIDYEAKQDDDTNVCFELCFMYCKSQICKFYGHVRAHLYSVRRKINT